MSQDGPALLVVDDNEDNLYTLTQRLRREGYTNVGTARDGRQALELLRARPFDLVLLDVMMPEVNGYQVLEALKADDGLRSIPVIMISAVDELESVIRCVELGAADYLPKPFNPVLLRARIGACLEKKRLHDRLLEWSRTLEERVREKVAEVERLGRLKRFFSPHLAELIVAGGAEDPLKTHRREITVVFLDLRGFSTFAETTEPEEVMGVLHEYHAAMGQADPRARGDAGALHRGRHDDLLQRPGAGAEAGRAGHPDGHRDARGGRANSAPRWRKRGHDLGLGVGIAEGYATIGAIGFEGRWDYGAIGTVTNLAARLCGEAKAGQILVSPRVAGTVEGQIDFEPVGTLTLKGFLKPVEASNVVGPKAGA